MASDFDDSFENDITTRTASSSNTHQDAPKESVSIFNIKYYQKFFDVDTDMVIDRVMNLSLPRGTKNSFMENQINRNPDLYGPFWIVVGLLNFF